MKNHPAPGNRFAIILHEEWVSADQPTVRALAKKTRGHSDGIGLALSHVMIYSTLHGRSLPLSWENAKRVVEAVLSFTERSPSKKAEIVARCKEIYFDENRKRATIRSVARLGGEAQRRLRNAASEADDTASDAAKESLIETVTWFKEQVDSLGRQVGPQHSDTLDARRELAYWTGQAGSSAEAANLLEELASDLADLYGSDDPATHRARHTRAYWIGVGGNPDEAARLLQELVLDRARVLGQDHELTQKTRQNAIAWLSMTSRCSSG